MCGWVGQSSTEATENMQMPKTNTSILSRDIFLFCLQDQESLAKCLAEASIDWTAVRIRPMAKKLESSRVTTKCMRNVPNRQPQAQVNQHRHQRVDLSQHKKRGNKKKQPYHADQSQVVQCESKLSNMLSPAKRQFKQPQVAIKFCKKSCKTFSSSGIPSTDQVSTAKQASTNVKL